MDDAYARLRRADDARWTNADRRDLLKAAAGVSGRQAEARAEGLLRADAETARRLAEAKRSLAAARRQADGRRPCGPRGPRDPLDAGRSLRDALSHVRQRLADCRNRLADKTARLAGLRARLARESCGPAGGEAAAAAAGDAPALAALHKTSDALRLGNRRAARARDLIAENAALRSALNARLEADARALAAAVIELLARGAGAQRETARFDALRTRAEAESGRAARVDAVRARRLDADIAVLDSRRRKMIFDEEQADEAHDTGFGALLPTSIESDLDSMTSEQPDEAQAYGEKMPLMEWIDTGSMESQMYAGKEGSDRGSDESSSSSSGDYTYPREKVNRFKYAGRAEPSRAVQAVDYVRDALGFADLSEATRYVAAVTGVEARLRRMLEARRRALEVVDRSRRTAAELETVRVNCTPASVLRLDADAERVRRAADAQRARLRDVRATVAEYATLFDRLWFQLEGLAAKLRRCHVPAVRKYQLHAQKRTGCTEATMAARRMLQGLCLTTTDDDVDVCSVRALPASPCDPEPNTAVSTDPCSHAGRAANASGLPNPAADACRELTAALHAKIKACMVRIGGDFDAMDDKQSEARAYYMYDKQLQIQRALLRKNDRQSRVQPKVQEALEKQANVWGAAEVMTREQTKRQADDIVRWFRTPKDSDQAVRSRKPISFRKSRIFV